MEITRIILLLEYKARKRLSAPVDEGLIHLFFWTFDERIYEMTVYNK